MGKHKVSDVRTGQVVLLQLLLAISSCLSTCFSYPYYLPGTYLYTALMLGCTKYWYQVSVQNGAGVQVHIFYL